MKAWFDFGFNFVPRVWRDVIGSNTIVTNLFITITIILAFINIWRRKMPKEVFTIFFSFLTMLGFLLFYKGRLFENFLAFIFPFILFVSAWTCFILFKRNKFLGTLVIVIISGFTLVSNYTQIFNATNNTATTASYFKNSLIEKYPNQKFSLYNYNNINTDIAYTLSLYLDLDGKISNKGTVVGLANIGAPINHQIIIVDKALGLTMYSLTNTTVRQNGKENLVPVNPSDIYNMTENWFKH